MKKHWKGENWTKERPASYPHREKLKEEHKNFLINLTKDFK